MRSPISILILLAGVILSAGVWVATGGRVMLFLLPLLIAIPLAWRRR